MSDFREKEKPALEGNVVVNANKWLDENICGPFFNGLIAENPMVKLPYNAVASALNEHVFHGKVLHEIEAVPEPAKGYQQSIPQLLSGGLAMLYTYSLANSLGGRVLRGLGHAIKAEGQLAQALTNDWVIRGLSGAAYGAFQDARAGESQTSRIIGSATAGMTVGWGTSLMGTVCLRDRILPILINSCTAKLADRTTAGLASNIFPPKEK